MEKGLQKMMKPKVSAFDSMASEYNSWFEDEGKTIFATEVQALQQILPLLGRPWLEIGVGSGHFAQALGISIGLDPSNELLKIAKSRGVNALLGRGEATPFRDSIFGTAFLIVTLCFVDSPLAVLKEVDRILKDSGKIVLGLVLRESPWGKFYQHKKKLGHHFYKHATFYSFAELEALLAQVGFSTETVISTLFQIPGSVKGVESPRQGHSSNAGFTVITARKKVKCLP
jgi:SAM-dependent methyltransferase